MAGKGDFIGDALRVALETLSSDDALRIARKSSAPEKFEPFTTGYSYKRQAYYDPRFWEKYNDPLLDENGEVITDNERLRQIAERGTIENLIKPDNELMYRGMSADELADILLKKRIQSRGDMNFTGGQEGLTYFSKDPLVAESYSNSFAPSQYMPDMKKPAYVISAKRPAMDRVRNVPGTGSDEIGVVGSLPIEDIVGVHRGNTTAYYPAIKEKGFSSNPSAMLNWEEKGLEDILRGRAAGGRTGYGPGGVIDDIIKMAGRIVGGETDEAAKKAFANTRLKTPQGDPMRLYHLTPEDITEFNASPSNRAGPVVFLSPYADFQPAHHQAGVMGERGEFTGSFREGANVMPLYADVKNPLVLDHPRKTKEAAAKYQGGDREFPRYVSPEAKAAMEADGYDAVIFGGENPIPYGDRPMDARLGHQEARDEEFIVFDPKRVKSAISNTGEYDFTNPKITKAEGGQVREGYATKGRAVNKAMDAALRIVQEGLAGLAKDRGVTPTEIGKPFGSILPSVPYDEWRFEYEPNGLMIPQKSFDPESFRPGDVVIPLIGDRTANSRTITSIAGNKLERPVTAEGGPDYMRGPAQIMDKNVWASDKGAITKLNNRVDKALTASREAGYKDPNAYGVYVAMGPEGGDFSTHTAEALMGMLPHAKILKKDVAEFDREMRKQDKNWPGLMNPKAYDYVVNADAGAHRKQFVQAMDSGYWRNKGFPDASLARYATTAPDLVAAPTEAAGYAVAKLNPQAPIGPITSSHRTYNTPMPGEYVGTMPAGIKRDDVFTQHSERFDANPPSSNLVMAKRRSFERNQDAYQLMHDQDIQKLIDFTNKIKNSYAAGGEIDDDDINDALRIAKDVGGSTPVMMEDAKGNKYDAQGNVIPPQNPGPNPARSDATPQSVAAKAVNDPATYDALMERYAVPDRDIAEYEALKATVGQQPQDIRQMTHVGDRPRREVAVDMPLFGGEYSMGTAPYDVASGMQGAAQTAYDLKTAPFYFNPFTAPIAAGMDLAEGIATNDPLTASLAVGFGPGGKYAKAAGIGAVNYFMNPDEAEAGPERWFSKAMEVARAIPMEKMTGQQALAMLRKGVSPEELKWTGADAFLPQQKQITKQDLVDYLAKNRVQLNEINLGGERPSSLDDIFISDIPDEIQAKYMPEINRANEEMTGLSRSLDKMRRSPDQSNAAYEAFKEISRKYAQAQMELGRIKLAMKQEYVDSTGGLSAPVKFGPGSGYGETLTTPGGKSYRENLFAVPTRNIFTPFVEQMKKDVWSENYKEALSNGFSEERAKTFADKFNNLKPGELAKFLGKEEELASIFEAQRSLKEAEYTGGHWSEYPNVIAHTRTNELMYEPPGANRPYRVHNVEETQSDPGQAGRKSGFKDPQAMAAVAKLRQEEARLRAELKSEQARLYKEHQERIAPYTEERVRYERELREKYKRGEISFGDMNRAAEEYPSPEQELTGQYRAATYETLNPIMGKIAANEAEINRIGGKIGSIPMMPYVTSTEGWTDFAIKKELDRAFDSGADYFSWSPGEVHAERYDLSKHISKVQYNPDDGSLLAYDPKGRMVINESVNDPDDLDEYLGKELADKMRIEADSRRSVIDEYEIAKDKETGEWGVYLYGEPSGEAFSSKGDARDYLNELVANDLAQNPAELSGLDLKVGGEGMLGYYNKIYLKRVQEVIKKATGTKPEIETITVNTPQGPRQQLGIRLTDEMREKARFSDFNKGGRVSNPVVNKALQLTRDY